MPKRGNITLRKQWRLVRALTGLQRGCKVSQLCDEVGVSRATLYRYFTALREAGVPIETLTVNGEARVRLWGDSLPPLGPTGPQLAALHVARKALAAFEGAELARELDSLMKAYPLPNSQAVTLGPRRAAPNPHVPDLDRAIRTQRRTRIRYRAVNAPRESWRNVDPLGLRYAKGSLYFVAFDERRATVVPFKVDRISVVQVLAERATAHPEIDIWEVFERASKIWAGDLQQVRVRLAPEAARFVHEYPLIAGQAVEDQPDGSVIVAAAVNGLIEAKRWVLSWGKNAEALEPAQLRTDIADEVSGAAAHYLRPTPRKPRAARSGRLTDRETGTR